MKPEKIRGMRPNHTVKFKDGREGKLSGAHLTPDGIALRVKVAHGSIVEANVLLKDVDDVPEAKEE